MNIIFICGDCNGQSEGVFKKRTNYNNITNMNELNICCSFCGKVLAISFTSKDFIDNNINKKSEGTHEYRNRLKK